MKHPVRQSLRFLTPERRAVAPSWAHEAPQFSSAHLVWLLDLDNTLHDAMRNTFPGIKQAMGQYIERALAMSAAEAGELRDHYGRLYGATMLGLARHHRIDPHDFLPAVHPLEQLPDVIRPSVRLSSTLRKLPGRRVLLTNAPAAYARAIVRLLGIAPLLHELISIEHMGFGDQLQPKPSRPMFRRVVAAQRTHGSRCILVEDSIVNLRHARAAGIQGVLVTGFGSDEPDHRRQARAFSARRVVHRLHSVAQLPRLAKYLQLAG